MLATRISRPIEVGPNNDEDLRVPWGSFQICRGELVVYVPNTHKETPLLLILEWMTVLH